MPDHHPREVDELLGLLRREAELVACVVVDGEVATPAIEMPFEDVGEPEEGVTRGPIGHRERGDELAMHLGRASPRTICAHVTCTPGERRRMDCRDVEIVAQDADEINVNLYISQEVIVDHRSRTRRKRSRTRRGGSRA
jgi:hypothetical protein